MRLRPISPASSGERKCRSDRARCEPGEFVAALDGVGYRRALVIEPKAETIVSAM